MRRPRNEKGDGHREHAPGDGKPRAREIVDATRRGITLANSLTLRIVTPVIWLIVSQTRVPMDTRREERVSVLLLFRDN